MMVFLLALGICLVIIPPCVKLISVQVSSEAEDEVDRLVEDAQDGSECWGGANNWGKRIGALKQLYMFHKEDPRTLEQIKWSARKDLDADVRRYADQLMVTFK